ncbi:uncharacterized protein LOC110935635 [Helianthus annuus]|uniref:uncharacterized protein LOC110935635 n=1 Tax=Helianthus annuus TaxID=4232 RepID=UPI000B9068FA|nr:uncharacterized protein LOC110935635 [Helianthus annuus]
MPPRRVLRTRTVNPPPPPPMPTNEAELNALIEQRIAQAIALYEASRVEQSGGIGGSGGQGQGGSSGGTNNTGCTFKQFLDCKPLNYDGTGGTVAYVRWTEKTDSTIRMSRCSANQQVTFVTCLFLNEALTWWNLQVQTLGDNAAYALTWEELKERMRDKYCSRAELQKLENEFWNLTMVGADITGYTQRFHDLSRVIPYLVTPEYKRIERYIWGLSDKIRSLVTAAKPTTITQAVTIAVSLTEDGVRMKIFGEKGDDKKETHAESSNRGKRNYSNFKKGTRATNDTGPKKYAGTLPKCERCKYHHLGDCRVVKCDKCGKNGHRAESCWGTGNNTGSGSGFDNKNGNGNGRGQGCFGCGSKDHYKKDCPKENQARGRSFVIGAKDARQDPNVVTGTFLLNDHFASILFDTGADFSFISIEFKNILGLEPSKLDVPYSIELANGRLIETGEVVKECTLELGEQKFNIDLLPIELGSFNVVVGMDWLSNNRAEVVCHEKIIRLPLPNEETLVIHGEKRDTPLRIINCMKAQKYLRKGYIAFLAHVVDKKADGPKLTDIPVVKEFPEVFPEDLP